MDQFKENNGDGYYNSHLFKAGLIVALGGLFIFLLMTWIGMLLMHR
jgi:hypothetical protein